ncbi:hypothetical protein [uncultured Massilia sp.]|uniref:hypothetical protein n=1 Tax=uncultured Massilia sp. TaxID=169973 RepID=UPI00258FDA23|nr:hypothetical protein [uncultured Massilia sp.]
MRIRELAIGAVLAALLAGGVVLTIPSPTPLVPPTPVPAPIKVSTPPETRTPAIAATPPATMKEPAASWRELHAKYAAAPNLRAFFYETLRKPDQGAMYYAISVLHSCRFALKDFTPALSGPRRAAAAALQQRCDFSTSELEDAERALTAVRELGPRDDVLSNSMFDYIAADSLEAREKVLLAAFEQGNPEIIAALIAPAVKDGMPAQTTPEELTALGMPFASLLVACRLGADCGPGSVRTLELCMEKGWCADSIPAALRQGLGKDYAVVDRVATRVLDDIRRRDARRLAVLRNR